MNCETTWKRKKNMKNSNSNDSNDPYEKILQKLKSMTIHHIGLQSKIEGFKEGFEIFPDAKAYYETCKRIFKNGPGVSYKTIIITFIDMWMSPFYVMDTGIENIILYLINDIDNINAKSITTPPSKNGILGSILGENNSDFYNFWTSQDESKFKSAFTSMDGITIEGLTTSSTPNIDTSRDEKFVTNILNSLSSMTIDEMIEDLNNRLDEAIDENSVDKKFTHSEFISVFKSELQPTITMMYDILTDAEKNIKDTSGITNKAKLDAYQNWINNLDKLKNPLLDTSRDEKFVTNILNTLSSTTIDEMINDVSGRIQNAIIINSVDKKFTHSDFIYLIKSELQTRIAMMYDILTDDEKQIKDISGVTNKAKIDAYQNFVDNLDSTFTPGPRPTGNLLDKLKNPLLINNSNIDPVIVEDGKILKEFIYQLLIIPIFIYVAYNMFFIIYFRKDYSVETDIETHTNFLKALGCEENEFMNWENIFNNRYTRIITEFMFKPALFFNIILNIFKENVSNHAISKIAPYFSFILLFVIIMAIIPNFFTKMGIILKKLYKFEIDNDLSIYCTTVIWAFYAVSVIKSFVSLIFSGFSILSILWFIIITVVKALVIISIIPISAVIFVVYICALFIGGIWIDRIKYINEYIYSKLKNKEDEKNMFENTSPEPEGVNYGIYTSWLKFFNKYSFIRKFSNYAFTFLFEFIVLLMVFKLTYDTFHLYESSSSAKIQSAMMTILMTIIIIFVIWVVYKYEFIFKPFMKEPQQKIDEANSSCEFKILSNKETIIDSFSKRFKIDIIGEAIKEFLQKITSFKKDNGKDINQAFKGLTEIIPKDLTNNISKVFNIGSTTKNAMDNVGNTISKTVNGLAPPAGVMDTVNGAISNMNNLAPPNSSLVIDFEQPVKTVNH